MLLSSQGEISLGVGTIFPSRTWSDKYPFNEHFNQPEFGPL